MLALAMRDGERILFLQWAIKVSATNAICAKGRDVRDIILGLAKTCMKLNLSFYDFLGSRLGIIPRPQIPLLPKLIRPAPS